MARKPRCPDKPKDKKKKPKLPSSRDRGGSTHVNQKIGLFEVTVMEKCIAEIKRVEADCKVIHVNMYKPSTYNPIDIETEYV